MSRESFAHGAALAWPGSDDERAPGGAVTEELCGSLDHEPPCPLAPHFTSAVHRGETLEIRVLFACDPADEPAVRSRIDAALGRWPIITSGPDDVHKDEAEHSARLAAS